MYTVNGTILRKNIDVEFSSGRRMLLELSTSQLINTAFNNKPAYIQDLS